MRSYLSLPDVGDGRFNRELPPWAAMDPDKQGGRLFAVKIFGVGWQTDVVVSLPGSDPGAPADTKHRHKKGRQRNRLRRDLVVFCCGLTRKTGIDGKAMKKG